MIMNYLLPNRANRSTNPDRILQQFEKIRNNYLADLQKLRSKYAAALIELTIEYNHACALQE